MESICYDQKKSFETLTLYKIVLLTYGIRVAAVTCSGVLQSRYKLITQEVVNKPSLPHVNVNNLLFLSSISSCFYLA